MKRYHNHLFSWITSHPGICIVLIFLTIHLVVMPKYGFTWDFHFHFFGGGKLLGYEPKELEPRNLPYVAPDPTKAWSLPYGPLMSIPPMISYLTLHRALSLLPSDISYHLPIVLWGVLGIGITYLFMKEAANKYTAILAVLFIALTPRYFGDLHNNMKDIPSAVIFLINMWALWRLTTYKRRIDLFWAGLAFAVAFNIKINSIFIPIVLGAWIILLYRHIPTIKATLSPHKPLVWYGVIAPVFAFLLWWVFWPNPIFQLLHAYRTFGIGTNNIEVILRGSWYCSGSNVPWYYPYWYLGITTPLPILLFCCIRIVRILKSIYTKTATSIDTLLLCWLFVPLTRYLSPFTGVIDGVRHFEEVLFPIAILAAMGITSVTRIPRLPKVISHIITWSSILWLTWNVIAYHPYQIAYFNELVGGAKGALGNYDLDYWGASQKEAVLWVNDHAPQNATVHIVMAAAVAGQYLRPDLLAHLNSRGYDESDYVILLNRQSFLYRFFYAYEYNLHHTPIHTINVAGAPLTWIYDNRTNNKTPRQTPWWKNEDPCIIRYWRGETTYWK